MFLDNKYTKWYLAIIQNPDVTSNYCEVHHKIPKSLGGSDAKSNLVRLSARQHFVCHLLLTKMVDGEEKTKMMWALHKMAFSNKDHRNLKSGEYELARRLHQTNMAKPKSKEHIAKIAIANTGKKRSEESKRLMSEKAKLRPIRKQSPEEIEKRAAKLRGVPKSEEHRQALSKSRTGSHLSDETKRKMSESTKGKPKAPFTEAHRLALSLAAKNRAKKVQ